MNSHYHSAKFVILLPSPAAVAPPLASQDEHPFKRRRLGHYPDIFWLEEVRSKIWNNNALESELFRKVEVTQAHYTELQNRLERQHPDRDSPTYDPLEHNVQSIKLDVLGLTFLAEAPPPRYPDNTEDQVCDDDDPGESNEDGSEVDDDDLEASNEDGAELDDDDLDTSSEDDPEIDGDDREARDEDNFDINSSFSFNLQFLDLSTLDLKEEVPDCLPLPLFIRQEYDDISALIKREPRRNNGSVIVSGQPGTGELVVVSLSLWI